MHRIAPWGVIKPLILCSVPFLWIIFGTFLTSPAHLRTIWITRPPLSSKSMYTGCNSNECTSLLQSYVVEMCTLRCYTLYILIIELCTPIFLCYYYILHIVFCDIFRKLQSFHCIHMSEYVIMLAKNKRKKWNITFGTTFCEV